MNREDYIQCRQHNNIVPVAYDYYINNYHGKNKVGPKTFAQTFPLFEMQERMHSEMRRRKGIDWGLLWKHYDEKFDVRLLYWPETGEIIQIL